MSAHLLQQQRLLRSELINNVLASGDNLLKVGRGKHLEPGIVHYGEESGGPITYLLPREAIEAMRPTAKGKPIVGRAGGFDHLKVNAADAAAGKYDGAALESYDGRDGWEWLLFQLKDAQTAEKCEDGYEFSCAYIPTEVDETPGVWHGVPYDAVIKNAEYTHFAIVPNPRYQGAKIELLNSQGGIVNKALKAVLSLFPVKDIKEILNSMEEDQKKAREEKLAANKTAYDEAMKNAKTDEEKAAAKAAFEKANAEAGAEPQADLPKLPLGGGDAPHEPGVPGTQDGGAETPEQKAKRELDKQNADAAAAKAKEEEDRKKLEAEKEASLQNELGNAWAKFTADMIDDAGLAKKVLVNSAGAVKPYAEQPDEVKAGWKSAYLGASGTNLTERCNSLGAKATAAVELRNAAKAKAEKEAKEEAARTERFNALKRAAEERGGTAGSPFVGIVSAQEKEDLGRARYGSR